MKTLNSDATCFSQTNLLYMKNFYLLYQKYAQIAPQVEEQITLQLVEKNKSLVTQQVVGLLGGYVVACNHSLRKDGRDNPTIGLLICKVKDRIQAQYALESSSQPIGISEYDLEKFYPEKVEGATPTIKEIEAKLNEEDHNTKN